MILNLFLRSTFGITLFFSFFKTGVSTSRTVDFSIPWRPMRIPFQTPSHLISITNFDTTSKSELVQIAQHNAHILKQYKENKPSNKYDSYTFMTPHLSHNTMAPLNNYNLVSSGSNNDPSIIAFPQGYNNLNIRHHAQQPAPPPKSVDNIGQRPSYLVQNLKETTLGHTSAIRPTNKPHPVMTKLQAHLSLAQRQKGAGGNLPNPNSNNKPNQLHSMAQTLKPLPKIPSILFNSNNNNNNNYNNLHPNSEQFHNNNNQYIAQNTISHPTNEWSNPNIEANYHSNNIKAANLPPSILTPFFQQVNLQQRPNSHLHNNNVNSHKDNKNVIRTNNNNNINKTPNTNNEIAAYEHTTIPTVSLLTTVQTYFNTNNKNKNNNNINNDGIHIKNPDENKYFYNTGSEFIKLNAHNQGIDSHYDKKNKNKLTVYRDDAKENAEKANILLANSNLQKYIDEASAIHNQKNSHKLNDFKPLIPEKSNPIWSTFVPFLPTPVHPQPQVIKPIIRAPTSTAATARPTNAPISFKEQKIYATPVVENFVDEQEHNLEKNEIYKLSTIPPTVEVTTENFIESSTARHRTRTKLRRRRPKPQHHVFNVVEEITTTPSSPQQPTVNSIAFADNVRESTQKTNNLLITRGKNKGWRTSTVAPSPSSSTYEKKTTINNSNNRTSMYHSQITEPIKHDDNTPSITDDKKDGIDYDSQLNDNEPLPSQDFAFTTELIETKPRIPTTTPFSVLSSRKPLRTKLRQHESRFRPHKDSSAQNSNKYVEEGSQNSKASNPRPIITTTLAPDTVRPAVEATPNVKKLYDSKNRPRFSIKDYRQKFATVEEPAATTILTPTLNTRLKFPSRNKYNLKNITDNAAKPKDVEESVTMAEETTNRNDRLPTVKNHRFRTRTTTTARPTISTSTASSTRSRETASTTRRGYNKNRASLFKNEENENVTTIPTIRKNSTNLLSMHVFNSTRQRLQNNNNNSNNNRVNVKPQLPTVKPSDDTLLEQTTTVPIESAIMKIAKDNHSYRPQLSRAPTTTSTTSTTTTTTESIINSFNEIDDDGDDVEDYLDLNSASSDYSQKVTELTISGNVDDKFKSVNTGLLSRRIPGYFTLATEDPILPIEAFFPQLKSDY